LTIPGLFLTLGFFPSLAMAGTCTVDATTTDQFIRGFGAASAWNAASNLSPYASTLWANDNVNGHAGLSMLRTRIDPTDTGSGSAWNSEAGPMTLAKSTNPDIQIWSTEWSPPAAYKGNDSVDGSGTSGNLSGATAVFTGAASGSPNSADTGYAAYLTRYDQYIKNSYGVNLYAISCQNEPDWNPTYEAAIWNAGQFDVFTGAFHSALSTAGLSTNIIITESFSDNLALAATTMDDATNAPFVNIIAGHIYGGGPNSLASGNFSHLTNQEGWETEISDVSGAGPDNSMTSGLVEAGWIHNSIVNANLDAFHHWWIWGSDNSALITSSGVSKKLMVIGQYSKFVRPGYYRMGATTVPSGGVSVSAYKNTNTSAPATVVIVAINANSSTTSQTFSFSGVNVTSVVPWVTDNNNNLVQMAAVPVSGNSFTYPLTGPSVTSFVGVVSGSTGSPVPTATNTPVPPTATNTGTPAPPTATFTFTSTPTPVTASSWRINAGGPVYTDSLGNAWLADTQFTAGSTIAEGGTIAGTNDSTLYDTQRYGTNFSYVLHVPAGSYQATLLFAETYSGDNAKGDRVFNVLVNGVTVISNLDVFATVGANTALNEVINNIAPLNGAVTIQFVGTTSTDTNAMVEALQLIPQPAAPTATKTSTPTSTFTNTATNTSTNTVTNTPTSTFTNTATFTSTPTSTFTFTSTATATNTNTLVPPTATFAATATTTNTSVPPTATTTIVLATVTPSATPTNTNTSVPPTSSPTGTATFTFTNTATNTSTNTATAVPPTATATLTPTETHTPVPPTATFTNTLVPTATNTPEPPTATSTPAGTGSLTVYYLTGTTANDTNSPHPQIEVKNTGTGPLSLNNVEIRYWFNCDCTNQTVQTSVDWAGLMPTGTSVTSDVLDTVVPTSEGGQTDYISYKFTGNLVLQPGQSIEIQGRFNLSDWSNMVQNNDWSYADYTSFTEWTHITGYVSGSLVWGQEPTSVSTSLAASSVIAFPNPSTGNGVNLAINMSGNGSSVTGSSVKSVASAEQVDPNAQIAVKVFTLAGRMIWSTTLSGTTFGSSGSHTLYWDEKSLSGANLANGLYIVMVTVKSQGQTSSSSVKVLILR